MRTFHALCVATLALSGCKSDYEYPPRPDDPTPPIDTADTGVDVITGEEPIAMCSVNKNPVQPPFETAIFDGSASYDPGGGTIEGYEWALTAAPPGNGAALSSRTGVQTRLTPQLAGEYRVELTVINNLGLRSLEPCIIDLSANPDEDLWVELYWSNRGDDMDLHLLRPGGTPRSYGDCYYANCKNGLDWGTLGEDSDDPILDLDDIPGRGPENINISDPEPGEFTVFVHDYPGSVFHGPNTVTVNIYLGGEKVFSESRRIVGEDSDEYFARVNPLTGIVTPL